MTSTQRRLARPGWLDRPRAWEVGIALAAAALFAHTVSFGWVYDDPLEIVRNITIRSLANIPAMFTTTVWAGSGMETYLYRPVTLLSFALNHAISGLEPWTYHLANVLLHALVSVLVFRLGRLWGLSTVAAGVGALIFALHPVHVEVVAAAHGRKDLLVAAFVAGMVLAHRDAVSRWRRPALPVLLFAAALLSKEVGAAGLLLVAVHDAVLETNRRAFLRRNRVATIYAAYALVLLSWVVVRTRVTGGITVPETSVYDNPLVAAAPLAALATAIVVVGIGLAHLLVPARLSPDYSFDAIPIVVSPLDPRLLATLAAIVLLIGAVLLRRTRPWGILAGAWYGLALLPASNLLVRVGTIFGDRLLYLPGAAFCLIAGAAVSTLVRRRPAAGALAAAGLLAALSVLTVRYSLAWTDDVTLFRHAVAQVPRSTKAHHKLGEELLRAGDVEIALVSLRRALEIAPGNEFAARTLAQAKLRQAVSTGPDPAAGADALYSLGRRLRDAGEVDAAVGYWEAAIARTPDHAPSLADLGTASLLAGDTIAARAYLERAVDADPTMASAWFNLAAVHLARDRSAPAAEALRHFIDAAGAGYASQVAWARARLRDLEAR